MKYRSLLAMALLALVAIPAPSQRINLPPPEKKPEKKEKARISEFILRAQFVYVMAQREAELGQRPEAFDYQTVVDVEAALRKWDRFKLVMSPQDADLIFSVRRAGGVLGSVVGGPRAETSSSGGDYLAVFDARLARVSSAGASLGSPLWRATQKDGLAKPRMSLLKALEEEMAGAPAAKTP